jgi:hypothetical protein
MVRKGGLEPPWVSPPDPKSGASANSATFAMHSKSTISKHRAVLPMGFGSFTRLRSMQLACRRFRTDSELFKYERCSLMSAHHHQWLGGFPVKGKR